MLPLCFIILLKHQMMINCFSRAIPVSFHSYTEQCTSHFLFPSTTNSRTLCYLKHYNYKGHDGF